MLAGDVLLREAFGLHLSREELDACAVKVRTPRHPSKDYYVIFEEKTALNIFISFCHDVVNL